MLLPRTIRGQLIASLVLFEFVALAFFTAVLIREDSAEAQQRTIRRLEYQASELSVVSGIALRDNNREMLQTIVNSMLQFPSVAAVKITDLDGRAIAASTPSLNGTAALNAWELRQIPNELRGAGHADILEARPGVREGVAAVRVQGTVQALIWVYPKESARNEQLKDMLRVSALGAIAVTLACTLLAAIIARSLTSPLTRLLGATRRIIRDPEDLAGFPLAVTSTNEASELVRAFNSMVESIEEQRSGLNDTMALLDSMLAHAPIGMAFFDSEGCIVRVNQFLVEITGVEMDQFLGRNLREVFAPEAAATFSWAVAQVFEQGRAVQDVEVAGEIDPTLITDWLPDEERTAKSWLVNVYPVRTAGHAVRWAGAVILDVTERRSAEESLRRTEKLAAAGRLAASIAHEINNPLEAVTNLLYLLRQHESLDREAKEYADSAQHEVARVSEITQQMLRFHRQSTLPAVTEVPELLESVLTLYQGRVATLQVELERRYRGPCELFCFSGELRQLFANLVGNSLDAMSPGGNMSPGTLIIGERRESSGPRRLVVCARPSRGWRGPAEPPGIRVTIADTGQGMTRAVRQRIFEPFFTTKEATGTGLGLWVSAEIMAKHEVVLRIRSRTGESPGKSAGTVFMLFFPAALVGQVSGTVELQAAATEIAVHS
jgi:signal transduction histidine kinase